jgi:hypothetical protein
MEHFLKDNFDVELRDGITRHKHFMQLPEAAGRGAGVLVVIMVRNPYDWAVSLRKICHGCESLQNLSSREFIASPVSGYGGKDVVLDTQAAFANVLEMRQMKIRNWLETANAASMAHVVVRMEDILYPFQQIEVGRSLQAAYTLKSRHPDIIPWRAYMRTLSQTFDPEEAVRRSVYFNLTGLSTADPRGWGWVRDMTASLDHAFEASLGYRALGEGV